MKVRLNKYLASCGLGSRRKVESFITSHRISINGSTVTDIATYVDTETDTVSLDKRKLHPVESYCHLALNKPKGLITTTDDDLGRPTVMDIIPDKYKKLGVFPVGRLDKDTEGILLFTNDGELANRLCLPKFEVFKEYYVELDKPLEDKHRKTIEKGIFINQLQLKTKPAEIKFSDTFKKRLTIIVHEGKKRQIRYTFKNLGYKIVKLKRTSFGPVKVSNINKGTYRILKKNEIQALYDLVSKKN